MIANNFKCKSCADAHCAVGALSEPQVELLSNNISEVHFNKRENLFIEDSLTSHVIFIKKGLVKVHMHVTEQKDFILKIAAAPAYLGLSTIFGDCIYRYSATTLEPTTACFIDIETFKYLIHNNGRFAYELIADICKNEICDFRRYVNQTHNQTPGRLAGALIYFAKEVYRENEFDLSLTQKEVAELIGTSRESVTRCLSSFKKDGIIDLEKHHISVLKMDALERINRTG